MTTGNRPGWAVQLLGKTVDLEDWQGMLPTASDPCVETYVIDDDVTYILRCGDWDLLSESQDIYADLARVMPILNGLAVCFHDDAEPVTAGPIMRFNSDGTRMPIMFAIGGTLNITFGNVRARGKAAIAGQVADIIETSYQQQYRSAANQPDKAELLRHIAKADNWFDLYKVMELAEALHGGEHKLVRALGGGADWKAVKRNANVHRHAPGSVPLPPRLVEWREAKQFLLSTIPRLLGLKPPTI